MRGAWAFLLVAPLLAGCLDPVLGRAPVVLVEHAFTFEGTGTAEAYPGWPCPSASLDREAGRVEVRRPGEARVGFVLLRETGASWRAANETAGPVHTLTSLAGGRASGATHGMDAVFRHGPQSMYEVRWDGRHAWLNDTRLERDEPRARSWTYHVPAQEGGWLRVTETVTATYLGRMEVRVLPWEDCRALT